MVKQRRWRSWFVSCIFCLQFPFVARISQSTGINDAAGFCSSLVCGLGAGGVVPGVCLWNMNESDTHIQMVVPAGAMVLQVYNQATDSWTPSFDICARLSSTQGARLHESMPIADLPAQQGMPQQVTIKTADVSMYRRFVERFPSLHDSDRLQYSGQLRIWVRICFLDAWKVLDQLYAETTHLWRALDKLGEKCRALETALHDDMRGRLERLQIHCGLTAADTSGSEDG